MTTPQQIVEETVWPTGTIWPPQDEPYPVVAQNLADFGPSIASTDVDLAVLACFKKWYRTYLHHVCDERGVERLAYPKNFLNVVDDVRFPDSVLPVILIATSKTDGTLQVSDEGLYVVPWVVAVSAVARGRNRQEARRNASLYELAFRQCLVQKSDLDSNTGKFAKGTRWLSGGQVVPLRNKLGSERWLGEGSSRFWIYTDGAVQRNGGPAVPDQDPYEPLATVESVDFDLIPVPLNDDEEGDGT